MNLDILDSKFYAISISDSVKLGLFDHYKVEDILNYYYYYNFLFLKIIKNFDFN